MAYKDPRSPLFTDSLSPEPSSDPIQEQADRLFAELTREMGLSIPEIPPFGTSVEECTVIYDKFAIRRR